MKISIEQLNKTLSNALAPLYLVSGDEPLQVDEAVVAIRQQVQKQGFGAREVLYVESGFDWETLKAACHHLSLFSDKKLIELRLSEPKVGSAGAQALMYYTAHFSKDTVLLISMPKLDAAMQKSKWYRALDEMGVTLPIWPIPLERLPAWVQQRLLQKGLQPGPDVAKRLAERTEGNLLATAQDIEKIHIRFGDGPIEWSQVDDVVGDNARFDVFELVDTVLSGNIKRINRVLLAVAQEGIEPIIVLWALQREIRQLASMAQALEQGDPVAQVLSRFRVWPKRKPLVGKGVSRLRFRQWHRLLADCAAIDRTIKGLQPGDVWFKLQLLCLTMAGKPIFR